MTVRRDDAPMPENVTSIQGPNLQRAFGRRAFLRGGLVAVAAPSAFLAACGGGSTTTAPVAAGTTAATATGATTQGGTLVVATSRAALGLDPAAASGAPSLNTWLNMYDTLFDASTPPELAAAKEAATNGLKVQPMLASAWESSKNGKVWRISLQPDAKSARGNPLTAEDVIYSMDRGIQTKYTPAFFLGLAGITKASQFKKIDDKTVELTLPAPAADYFLQVVGAPWCVIYDSIEMKKHQTSADPWASKWLDREAAGFGPFQVKTIAPDGTNVVLDRQSGYWGKAPLQSINLRTLPESSSRAQLLLSGQAQITDDLSPVQLDQVEKGAGTQIQTITTPGFCMLGMKNGTAPFDNADFRRGLAMAIPYDDIITSAYRGRAERWKTLLPPYYQGATSEFWTYDVTADAAKTALSQFAGTKVDLSYSAASDAQKNVAIVIQAALNKAGLNCTLNAMDQASYDTKRLGGELPFWIDDVNTPAVVSSFFAFRQLYAEPTLQPLFGYKNAELNAIVDKLGATKGAAAQNALISQAQSILMKDMPAIPVAWTGFRVPAQKAVQGYRGHCLNILWPKELGLAS
jgi:peptide/nickel transport system substrate-binding protein